MDNEPQPSPPTEPRLLTSREKKLIYYMGQKQVAKMHKKRVAILLYPKIKALRVKELNRSLGVSTWF